MKNKCYFKRCRSKELQETYIGDKLVTICKTHLLMSLRGVSESICKVVNKAMNTCAS
jgi:hypothetical protein